jgi:hypothetical protein
MVDRTHGNAPARYVAPNNNAQGWGIAALIVLLALVCAFSAFTIHKRTYRDPTNPLGESRAASEGERAPAPAAH